MPNHVPTFNGTAQIKPNKYKFGTHGCYFDGSTGYLTVPDHEDWDFGTGDFTIDMWVNLASQPATSGLFNIISHNDVSPNHSFIFDYIDNAGTKQLRFVYWTSGSGSATIFSFNTTLLTSERSHVAVVRNGTDIDCYVNGTQVGSTQNIGTDSIASVGGNLYIGSLPGTPVSRYFNGHLDELRISNTARWTTGFTPSTTAYTSDASTKLLLHFEPGDISSSTADQSLVDSGNTGHTITANGTVGTMSRFGSGGYFFDGNSDYLTLPDSNDWDVLASSSDYTIDFWTRPKTLATDFLIQHYQDATSEWYLYHTTTGNVGFTSWISGVDKVSFVTTSNPLVAGEWHHIAFVKSGTDYAIYVNGSQEVYHSDSDTMSLNGILYIGKDGGATAYFDGLMDEIRIQNSNYFNASPVVGLTDTITVPTEAYNTVTAVNVTVTPSTLSLTLAQNAPTISGSANITPSTLALTLTQQTPTVGSFKYVNPTTQALTLTQNAPTVSTDWTVTPATLTLTLTQQAPTLQNGWVALAPVQSLTLTQETPVPTVLPDITSQSLTVSLNAPLIHIIEDEDAGNFNLTLTLNAPSLQIDSTIFPQFFDLQFFRGQPDIIFPKVLKYLKDPQVTGGCPQCGTFLYNEGRQIKSEAVLTGRNFEVRGEDKYIRCARCNFPVKVKGHPSHPRGSRAGWGMKYVEQQKGD